MKIDIDYPITWLHDALLAAHPEIPWTVQGIDNEWVKVGVTDGGEWPEGFDLKVFAATVEEPVIHVLPTIEQRLAAVEDAILMLALGGL